MSGDRLRVLLIANTLPPRDVSGVGEQVLQLATGLRGEGCEVEVLGRGPGGAAGPKVLFPLAVVPAVWRALRRFRPHLVQVHESDGAFAALLVRLLSHRLDPRPRLLALLQVSYRAERRAVRPLRAPDGRVLGRPGAAERRFRRFKAPLHIALGQLTARLADRVLAPSAATAAEIERDYGVDRVAVVPNVTGGLDLEPRAPSSGAAASDARQRSESAGRDGGSPGGQTAGERGDPTRETGAPAPLLFVGRLRLRKGVEVLLEALARLAAASKLATAGPLLWIAGDGEHRPALERRSGELGLADRVVFLGRQHAGQVHALLTTARALVVPSIYEGLPLVILEAMAAGLPVVASRVSGIPEVVVDGETGWLVPPEDPGALAAALAEVLSDPAESARRGHAGRQRVENRYRPADAARRWLAEIDR